MLRHSHRLIAGLLFILIAGGYLLLARHFPYLYIVATYEDLIGEWAQVYFFAAAMVLAGIHAARVRRYRPFYLLLALACFYVVGEEISWGQRIFDIETPEFFRRHNLQKETNLHNLFTGPISTGIKSVLEWAISAGLVIFGLLYPLALRLRLRFALWLDKIGLPAAPLYLFPFFLLSAWLELGPFHFNEAEVAEILIPFALGVMALHSLFSDGQTASQPAPSASFAGRLSLAILALFLGVGVLAAGTTWACYQTTHLRERIDSRYLNGVEKFAGRYKRVELWDNAINLYRHVQIREPGRASLSRNLYRCYRGLGDQDATGHGRGYRHRSPAAGRPAGQHHRPRLHGAQLSPGRRSRPWPRLSAAGPGGRQRSSTTGSRQLQHRLLAGKNLPDAGTTPGRLSSISARRRVAA